MKFDLRNAIGATEVEVKIIERRNALLDKIITKYGFENDITLEFARVIDLVPRTPLGEAIVDVNFIEYMCMSE